MVVGDILDKVADGRDNGVDHVPSGMVTVVVQRVVPHYDFT